MGASLLGLLGNVATGGATGLIGVGLQRFFDWLNVKANLERDKLRYDHELAMRDKDAALMREEWAGRLRVAEKEGESTKEVAATQAFAQTLTREPERYATGEAPKNIWGYAGWLLLVLVDCVRGIVRPGLTIYLCVLTTAIWYEAKHLTNQEDLTADQALQVIGLIIETILYLTTTCVTWWFGTRNQQSAPQVSKPR